MWRIAAAASRGLLSSRGATPNLMPDRSIPSRFEGIAGGLATLRFARGLQAAVDPRIDRLASAGSTFSSAASSPEIAAEVVGSLGLASSSIAHKAREFSEGIRHYGRCYWELSKARLSMLVVATSGAGFVLGSSSSIDLAGLCCTCAGTMMVAASANSLNQVFERQNDAKMKRTRQRPLPSGRIGVPHAAMWASSVGLAGTILLAWKANYLAAGLAASNLVLYAFVYTPLKQIHPINTWVGAVVGAIPPLLGWAAASGEVSLNSMILPAALYYWQIPHFMALAYLCRDDYITGGFRMFTLADASGQRTALVSLRNCLYLLPLGFLAYDWGLTSKWFALESTLVTMGISIGALLFVRDRSSKNARRMFHGSLIYLPVFMSGLLLHRLPNEQNETMAEPTRNDEVLTETEIVASEGSSSSSSYKKRKCRTQTGPPIAYASVAPFPFLPAPMYFPSDS
ncbi:protoheme IX farnesyltransferase, mitochondrial-like [Zingiber officinale]|uniref:protoheme IX farnesyltransferase, mitochondrial-like n=1 Tax=Zingiber officinale TaxID=94328 RepID=UPI001C4D03E5|nr:protoheme IX farnesyltransferase, mitochondrial-like [Zingiber officinale]